MARISMLEGYSDLGLFCGEADVALDRLRVAIEEAKRVGIPEGDPRVASAQFFHDQESSFWTGSPVMLPWQCTRVTTEAVNLTKTLNDLIHQAGGTTVAPPDDTSATGTATKWLGIAFAGLALVYIVPPLFQSLGSKVSFRSGRAGKLAGLGSRRKRRR